MSRSGSFISVAVEEKLRLAFEKAGKLELENFELMEQLTGQDCGSSRQAAYNMICDAHRDGLLNRAYQRPRFRYSIDKAWRRPLPRGREAGEERRDLGQATPYVGPAFDRGPLVQSVGSPWDDGLEPCIGARIVDSLHRQFHEAFVE